MSKNIYILLSGLFFGLISLFHFLRLTFEWEIIINDFSLPSWLSGLFVVLGLLFFYSSLKLEKKDKTGNEENRKNE